jgi:hypothetical protein
VKAAILVAMFEALRLWPFLLGGLVACESQPAPPVRAETSAKAEAPSRAGYKPYGGSISLTQASALGRVLADPGPYRDKPVLVEGKVRRACSRKGCWMELAESLDPAATGCRVTFKDYGFFVPTSSAGADARVEAVVQVERVQAATVEHLESEGARFAHKNPDGTADEVRLVASAVELKQ